MTLAALLAALGIIAALVALVAWLVRKTLSAGDKLTAEAGRRLEAEYQTRGMEADLASVEGALEDERHENGQLASAVRIAENQRDAAVRKLAELGDPEGVAASIRADLDRMRGGLPAAGSAEATAGAGDRAPESPVRREGTTDPG